ncbi:hypothetical protein EVAR_74480_1 [Eumeta japonica]|uniref:Uncharacterized protein n=1 Tax=Eumeta variegata TaxID=151549 RepID=A0A4C1TEW1_EUMVA|nr:hypothetical protein EVAR_74480_1 [Eumeta japonica]
MSAAGGGGFLVDLALERREPRALRGEPIVRSRGKRECEPPKSRWSPPPVHTRNSSKVISALKSSRIKYLGEQWWANGKEMNVMDE